MALAGTVAQRFARWLLKVKGWTLEGERPDCHQYVLIAAPHTSNWDLPYLLACAASFRVRIRFMAKHTLFFPPLGWFMRALGGVPIVRYRNENTVDAMASAFASGEPLVLVVPAEGTRARADYWKSGFYRIAQQAGVPIVPSYLDYGNWRAGFGPPLLPGGDLGADMDILRRFYASMTGLHPEQFGPVRLLEEPQERDAA